MNRMLHQSVFMKLFAILVGASLAIDVLVFAALGIVVRPKHRHESGFQVDLQNHAKYLIEDLCTDPSLEHAKSLVQGLGLGIIAEGSVNWATSEDLRTLKTQMRTLSFSPPRPRFPFFGFSRPPRFATATIEKNLPAGPAIFTVIGNMTGPELEINWVALTFLIAILSTIIGLSFIAIRQILFPLRSLAVGVAQVGNGNFSYRVPKNGSDELSNLSDSFNAMSSQIQAMMNAKEQLLLDVSHELRTPIARAKVALELIPDTLAKEDIKQEIHEMETMVTGLLEGARAGSPHSALNIHEVDVYRLVNELTSKYLDTSPKVVLTQCPKNLMVRMDGERITTVLKNLIQNALKYSNSMSPVSLSVLTHEDKVVFEIQDHGTGIPESELQRVFEPFYRVDKSRTRKTGGYGLGLTLCKKIVEAHNGQIHLLSKENQGTTARVEIPIKDRSPK